jgi:hypothetical protein
MPWRATAMGTVREEVRSLLSGEIAEKLIDDLLDHHQGSKAGFLRRDWEKCLGRGGKLAETVMKIIHYRRTGNVVSSIKVEAEIQEAERDRNLPDEIRLLIPRHVRPLYDHRTKRGGAHGSFDPNALDARMVVGLEDWIVGELIRLYGKAEPQKAFRLVTSLSIRLIPLVEEIDGDLLVHKAGASCREELLLMLYARHPDRTSREQLRGWVKRKSRSNVNVALTRLVKGKQIHENADGIILTAPGLSTAEDLISTGLS